MCTHRDGMTRVRNCATGLPAYADQHMISVGERRIAVSPCIYASCLVGRQFGSNGGPQISDGAIHYG
jgi:hypothetical protein